MKVRFEEGMVEITRGAGEKAVSSESAFWFAVKMALRSQGHNVIKKLMAKDGHMVSDGIYYVRSRNMAKPGAFAIWDDQYAVRNVAEDFNTGKPLTLKLETNPRGTK